MYDVFITVGTDEGVMSRVITVTVAKILSDGGFGYYDETAKNPASFKTPCEAHEAFDHFANLESPNRQHFHNFIGKYLDQLQVEKGLVAVQLGRRSDPYIRQVIIEVSLLKGTSTGVVRIEEKLFVDSGYPLPKRRGERDNDPSSDLRPPVMDKAVWAVVNAWVAKKGVYPDYPLHIKANYVSLTEGGIYNLTFHAPAKKIVVTRGVELYNPNRSQQKLVNGVDYRIHELVINLTYPDPLDTSEFISEEKVLDLLARLLLQVQDTPKAPLTSTFPPYNINNDEPSPFGDPMSIGRNRVSMAWAVWFLDNTPIHERRLYTLEYALEVGLALINDVEAGRPVISGQPPQITHGAPGVVLFNEVLFAKKFTGDWYLAHRYVEHKHATE